MVARGERNVGWEVANRLLDVHGFEQGTDLSPGEFRRIVDSQHAATVTFEKWDEKGGGALTARFELGVARRDINELWRDLLQEGWSIWWPTLRERHPWFFNDGRPHSGMSYLTWSGGPRTYSEDEVAHWVDTYIPRLLDEAMSLSFVREHLAKYQTGKNVDQTRLPRIMNALLDGEWTEEADAELLGRLRLRIEKNPPGTDNHALAVRQLAAVEKWLAEHPDGIDRELAD